ncbi:MAG: sarcosine oxidase subunit gamma [Rhodobacteraceae bacterium]|nr:sarcosine oxidase subunit gamma [Paracoccaceae bacterium]
MAENTTIGRLHEPGMITLRCDLAAPDVRECLATATGLEVPSPGAIVSNKDHSVAWMSPDELLLILDRDDLPDRMETLEAELSATASLVVDTSSMRTIFCISGPDMRDVLAHETPVNLAPEAFGSGTFRRTRFGQVAASLWMTTDGEARLVCRSSESGYVEDLLRASAAGPRVGYLAS